jgi:glycosyltransferase involved in cell wall biosynthesis
VLILSGKKQADLSIISFPLGKAFTIPISNLSTIFAEIKTTHVIIGSYDPIPVSEKKSLTVHVFVHKAGSSKIFQGMRYLLLNIKIILKLFSFRQFEGQTIFFTELSPVLPMFFAKLSGMTVYWLLPSNISRVSDSNSSGFEIFLSTIGYRISDWIIVYSPHLITEWHLEPYRHKILIARHHFIDINTFTISTPFSDRPLLIGYIGRFSVEKGIRNFILSIPALFNARRDLSVLIGGDGPLKESIVASIQEQDLAARVDLIDWISHKDLPLYLNRLRLLVIPSYTEGLPNIMLEAMACGTPVLATPMGAIPDIIKDGETGFIMDNNSPECIAKNINRALNDPNLENIAIKAKMLVEREFTFEITVQQWKRILNQP